MHNTIYLRSMKDPNRRGYSPCDGIYMEWEIVEGKQKEEIAMGKH